MIQEHNMESMSEYSGLKPIIESFNYYSLFETFPRTK